MNQTKSITAPRSKTYEITMTALMAAVTCILAPLSIPIGPVPISFTNLAIYLSLYLLGWKRGTISYLIYLLLGLVGLPVFSGFTGGPAKLAGPTGGYIIGFIVMAVIAGLVIDNCHKPLDPAYRYDRRNYRMLPFRNHMVLPSCTLHLQSSSRSLRNPIHPGRPGKNDHRHDHRTDDKEKNTVIFRILTGLSKDSPCIIYSYEKALVQISTVNGTESTIPKLPASPCMIAMPILFELMIC